MEHPQPDHARDHDAGPHTGDHDARDHDPGHSNAGHNDADDRGTAPLRVDNQAGPLLDDGDTVAQIPTCALDERMGIRYLEASPDRVVATMPVAGNTQPFGLLHGGASCVLAESAGSVAAGMHAGPGTAPVGVDINATHHRAVRTGHVTAVATAAHRGRTFATYDIVISDDHNRRVCTARLTCFLRPMSADA